jgi:hypothetical protein
MRHLLVPLTLALAFRTGAAEAPPTINWYKGNLHTHTINSDGDSPPYDVMAWYKRNGYQFLTTLSREGSRCDLRLRFRSTSRARL